MNRMLPLRIGMLKANVAGGPYRQKPADMIGVKMAVEINLPCTISVPTRDFDVPNVQTFKNGLVKAIMLMSNDLPLYVGCMGGIGRTGLFMAGLAKVASEYRGRKHRAKFDPVLYVREHYMGHAVETKQQMEFIEDLNVSDIVDWCVATQKVLYGAANPTVEHEDEPNVVGFLEAETERLQEALQEAQDESAEFQQMYDSMRQENFSLFNRLLDEQKKSSQGMFRFVGTKIHRWVLRSIFGLEPAN